ncbi:hypothetical protein MASR2M69_19520 [Bacteroidota bacterium]
MPLRSLIDNKSWTLEAMVVKYADEIAQRHHDIEDGLTANIIGRKEFETVFRGIFSEYLKESDLTLLKNINEAKNLNCALHDIASLILGFYSRNLIEHSTQELKLLLKEYKFKYHEEFDSVKDHIYNSCNVLKFIGFDKDFDEKDKEFQEYLINRILNSHLAQSMDGKASYILRNLIKAYMSNPKQLLMGL